MKVGIYWNLNKGGYSLCVMKSDRTRGTVIAHCVAVDVTGARMVVSEGGRLRSIARHKEVHAWITGELASFDGTVTDAGAALGLVPSAAAVAPVGERLRYNPHRSATFTTDAGAPVHDAASVACRMVDGRPFIVTR